MTTTNDNGGMVELGDTIHLGCIAARRGSSNLSTPTIRKFLQVVVQEAIKVVGTPLKPCCTNCCISYNVAVSRWKGVANFENSSLCVRLRKLCHSFPIFRCADNLVSTTIIIKNIISTQVQKSVQHMQHILCNKLDVQIFQTKEEHHDDTSTTN